jgi:PKD repeat protein
MAVNDASVTGEGIPVPLNMLANDSDVDGSVDATSVVITAPPARGSLQLDPQTGTVTYTPATNFVGSDVFRYRVRDNVGLLSNIATAVIVVQQGNDRPVATNDRYLINEDATRTVNVDKGVLANDIDLEGDQLTATLAVDPEHGTLILHLDGSFTYTPEPHYYGSDRFLYRVSDGGNQSEQAEALLYIAPVPDAPAIDPLSAVIITEGTALAINGSFRDFDPNDSWTATIDYGDESAVQALPLVGTAFATNHSFADSGEYSIRVTITDRYGIAASAILQTTVQNAPPDVLAPADAVIDEGAMLNLRATFHDPGTLDMHTATIDWGDGTGPVTVNVAQAAATGTVSAAHSYADDGIYQVTVTVMDDEGAADTDVFDITVRNLSATVQAGPDFTVAEGQAVPIAIAFFDPGLLDTHTALVNWGDESAPEIALVSESTGIGTVLANHRYADDGHYLVTVTVSDNGDLNAAASFDVTVLNSAPVVDGGPDRIEPGNELLLPKLDLDQVVDPEFGARTLMRLAGSFSDPGELDSHTATIDWGDGTTQAATVVASSFHADRLVAAGTRGIIQAEHRYVRNGTYSVQLTVSDDDGGVGSSSFTVTINGNPDDPPDPPEGGCTNPTPSGNFAGNVRAKVSKGVLSLTGDAARNGISVHAGSASLYYRVFGTESTTINGQTGPIEFGPARAIKVKLGAGRDSFVVDGSSGMVVLPGNASGHKSGSNRARDRLDADRRPAGNNAVPMIDSLLERGLAVLTGPDEDAIALCGLTSEGPLQVRAGAGADTVLIDDSTLHEVKVRTGKGPDAVAIETKGASTSPSTQLLQCVRVKTRRGSDAIAMGDSSKPGNSVHAADCMRVRGGRGRDRLDADNGNLFTQPPDIRGIDELL